MTELPIEEQEEKLKATQAPDPKKDSEDKRMGRQVAFGIQQTLACWATDFIDPPISRWLQNRFGNKNHPVTHAHVWGGEIIGDTSAFFSYLAIKRFFSKPVDALISRVKEGLGGYLDKMGRRTLKEWADTRHLSENDAKYQRKLDEYKQFQAENLVDSTIVATSATLANVGIQRALGNKQGLGLILASKLIGATATMSLMLGLRTALPSATRTLDDELSNRYFSKLIRWTQRQLGIRHQDVSTEFALDDDSMGAKDTKIAAKTLLDRGPLVEKELPEEKRAMFLSFLRREYAAARHTETSAVAAFIEEQKHICQAFIKVLNPEGRFAQALAEEHYKALQELQSNGLEQAGSADEWKKAALISAQSIILNRRDDMLARLKLLNDSTFINEFSGQLSAEKAIPTAEGYALTNARKERYIESLVQANNASGYEPAVHIYANAKGQLIEHQALAKAFKEKGRVCDVLAEELERHLGHDATQVAQAYVQERHEMAEAVARLLKPEEAIVQEAVRRSENARRSQGRNIEQQSWQSYITRDVPAALGAAVAT